MRSSTTSPRCARLRIIAPIVAYELSVGFAAIIDLPDLGGSALLLQGPGLYRHRIRRPLNAGQPELPRYAASRCPTSCCFSPRPSRSRSRRGSDNLQVLARGISQGRAAGFVAALGFTAGILFHTTLAALGVAAVRSSPVAFQILKLAGAAYLVGSASRRCAARDSRAPAAAARHDLPAERDRQPDEPEGHAVLRRVPAAVRRSARRTSVTLQMFELGALFMLQTAAVFSLFGVGAGMIGAWLKRRRPACARRDVHRDRHPRGAEGLTDDDVSVHCGCAPLRSRCAPAFRDCRKAVGWVRPRTSRCWRAGPTCSSWPMSASCCRRATTRSTHAAWRWRARSARSRPKRDSRLARRDLRDPQPLRRSAARVHRARRVALLRHADLRGASERHRRMCDCAGRAVRRDRPADVARPPQRDQGNRPRHARQRRRRRNRLGRSRDAREGMLGRGRHSGRTGPRAIAGRAVQVCCARCRKARSPN